MSEEELIETLKAFENNRVEQLETPARNLFYAIMKIADERDRLNKELDKTRLSELNKEYIINELEKYGKERFNEYEAWKEECKNLCYINGITEMLDKLQELKGSDKE